MAAEEKPEYSDTDDSDDAGDFKVSDRFSEMHRPRCII
jgi:hypothetical protein